MAAIQFCLFKILYFFARCVRNKNRITKKVYQVLRLNSFWWVLLIGMCESNIAALTFKSAIQFNEFVSYDIFTKGDLIISTAFCFGILAYSFLFYPLLFRYEKPRYSEEVFDLSVFSPKCFWVEILLKCFRTFAQALINGIFINMHYFQLLGLILLDLTILIFIVISTR